jgi:hypothetical protein
VLLDTQFVIKPPEASDLLASDFILVIGLHNKKTSV